MRLLFVHERIGAFGGAEANVLVTADELRRRGHSVGLAHGRSTEHGEAEWHEVFADRFAVDEAAGGATLEHALEQFEPDVVFMHKFSDPAVLDALLACDRP